MNGQNSLNFLWLWFWEVWKMIGVVSGYGVTHMCSM
jgi:hypothetical protein